MNYIGIGILGFLAGYLCDIASLKRVPWAKQLLGIVAGGLIAYSLLMVCLKAERVAFPGWLTSLGWALLFISTLLLVYSLFIELPWQETYLSPGTGSKLVRTGTYALVRHPGVLWYALLLFSLILVSKSNLLLLASPLWIAMDVVWVVLQERLCLAKVFRDYDGYRQETPMLVPNRKSISACLGTLKPQAALGRLKKGGEVK